MGCTVREKHIRTNRRIRSTKNESNHSAISTNTDGNGESYYHMALKALYESTIAISNANPNPNPDSNSVFDDSGWGYCTEEQLEEILLKNLEFLYSEAINKLVALGYDEDVALNAILRNGHCYGGMDVLTNIMHNSLAYLNSNEGDDEEHGPTFMDLKQLEEYSLAGMVSLMQQVKPHLSNGDAMWCLLMSDLHVGRASVMEIPVLPSHSGSVSSESPSSGKGGPGGVVSNGGPVEVVPAFCRFHSGWGFGNSKPSESPMNGYFSYASQMSLQREIECPKSFNLSPSLTKLLRRNVAMFAAGFRANAKQLNSQSQACPSSLSCGDSPTGSEGPVLHKEESQYPKNQDVVNSMMNKFRDLKLGENSEKVSLDEKDETVLSLVHQIKDLEKQVKDRKEWAQEKALQAARKLSNDMTEFKMLRMEREETLRLKKVKPILDDSTIKRLTEMENSLRRASGQVDRANAGVRKLENENAEVRAEMQAFKLSASENVSTCLEVAKREKKCLKRLLALEKMKTKTQEYISAEKHEISEVQKEVDEVKAATKDAEAKSKQARNSKELVLTQREEEQHLKEASEANTKRKLEVLLLKTEIDFHRHKDDFQRLKQEYTRLKESTHSPEVEHQANHILTENSNGGTPQGETIANLLHELNLEDSTDSDRDCRICMKDEVSVVFLPCAHKVICASCNENYGKKGRAVCPYCRVPIEQRIRVYGPSS